MISRTCSFETPRLRVGEGHSAPLPPGQDLEKIVVEMLTTAVTRSLPTAWHGDYTLERARAWIIERDREGATLLVIERTSGEPVGLVILFELASNGDPGGVTMRLGYLLAEGAWGHGYASELVGGFVSWCCSQPSIRSIASGVGPDNVPSARALTKNGFVAVDPPDSDDHEQVYELTLHH